MAPGKRVHLHLEDLNPGDSCHFKRDQVHVEDPAGEGGVSHKVLQKCWREATFTSSSNSLEVVLLIGSRPGSPYRGFHGRYQAFGPLVVYNPQEVRPNSPQGSDLPTDPEDLIWLDPEEEEEEEEGGGSSEHVQSELTTASYLDDYIQRQGLLAEQDFSTEVSEDQRFNHISINGHNDWLMGWTVLESTVLPPLQNSIKVA